MSERRGDRAVSILLSVLIHGAIAAALLWGWWTYRSPPAAPQTLAIDATVVHSAPPAPATPPSPPAPTPPTPPPPDTQAQEQAAKEQAAKEQAEAQRKQQQQAEAEHAEAQRKQQQADEEAEAQRQAKVEAEQQAQQEADRKAKADADRKAAQALAQQQAEQRRTEQERAQREADMRSQLAAEEHQNAVQASPAKAEYLALIQARINHAWIRPPSARSGIQCNVHITQIPGGEITHVSVQGCNGDEAVRESVETAAYRASPLPAPADSALFDPNIDVTFAPDD